MRKLITVTEQTLWQIVGRIITSAASFIALGLVTRHYNELEVGAYTLAQTYLGMFFIIVDLGLNAYVLSKLKDDLSEANKLFNARFYWSLVLALTAFLLALLLPFGDELFKLAVFFGLITITGNSIFNSANLIFQKELKYQVSIIASTVGSITMVASLAALVFAQVPLYLLMLSYSLGWIANNITSLKLVSRYYRFKLGQPNPHYFISLLKKVWPISATLILNVVYFRFDAFILAATKGLSETAIYNLSYTLFQTALFIPTFIMNSYYPIILKELSDKKLLFHQLKLAFVIMIFLSLVGTVLTFLLSPLAIRLITGGGYEGSVISINILSLSFPAFFCTALLMWVYVSLKMYKPLMVVYLIGLFVNVALNFIYTPIYSYIATSWITVFSEYLIFTLLLIILWHYYRKDLI